MRLQSSAVLVTALIASGVGTAGCGGSDRNAAPVATTEVRMVKSYRFEPRTIEIVAGQVVTWTNEDNFTHSVRVDGQEEHRAEPGESLEIRFDEPGTHDYVCTLHSQDMEGTVTVR